MAKALSVDLRCRVLAAVDGGLSCRQAAVGRVSASSAIRWNEQRRKRGEDLERFPLALNRDSQDGPQDGISGDSACGGSDDPSLFFRFAGARG